MIRKEFCSRPQFLWITLWENWQNRCQGLDSSCSALERSNLMHPRKSSLNQGLAPILRALRGGMAPPRCPGCRLLNFGDKSTPERSLTGRIALRLHSRFATGLLQDAVAARMRVNRLHQRRHVFGRRELVDAMAEVEDVSADSSV